MDPTEFAINRTSGPGGTSRRAPQRHTSRDSARPGAWAEGFRADMQAFHGAPGAARWPASAPGPSNYRTPAGPASAAARSRHGTPAAQPGGEAASSGFPSLDQARDVTSIDRHGAPRTGFQHGRGGAMRSHGAAQHHGRDRLPTTAAGWRDQAVEARALPVLTPR
eukprot:14586762-Heterocapsa_arctica.AAC.1